MNRINLSALARSFFAFIPLSLVGASLITGEPPPATQEDHRITAIREVISSGTASTSALAESTEAAQFG